MSMFELVLLTPAEMVETLSDALEALDDVQEVYTSAVLDLPE